MEDINLIEFQIESLKSQLKEKEEELKQAQMKKVWKPKYGDTYFYINNNGVIRLCISRDSELAEQLWAIGNCFRTREEAELQLQRLKITAELERFAKKYNEIEVYNNRTLVHYYFIAYDYVEKRICIYFTVGIKGNDVCFSSEEIARQAIEAIGEERIKKYYLGVK